MVALDGRLLAFERATELLQGAIVSLLLFVSTTRAEGVAGIALIGSDTSTLSEYEDTLPDIARRHNLGYEEIVEANPAVDVWVPGEGTRVAIPGRHIVPSSAREGLVVNMPEYRLYYFRKEANDGLPQVLSYPVSIGSDTARTPVTKTIVIAKAKDPTWFPTASIRKEHAARGDPLPRMVPPGPSNPLGSFALRLGYGRGTYLIHGTNDPVGVGMAVTHGCIRMYPEHIEELFQMVPVGTKVSLIYEPVKMAWVNGELWIEVHRDKRGELSASVRLDAVMSTLNKFVGKGPIAIHWDHLREVVAAATGTPAVVAIVSGPSLAP